MTITVKAIYEHGVLRPIEPISLVEGTRVEVTVALSASKTTMQTAAKALAEAVLRPNSETTDKTPEEILAAIAAMPMEGSKEAFSAQDHDRVLYTQP